MKKQKKLTPIHPGEILREELLKPLNLSADQLAAKIHVPVERVTQILNGEDAIGADTELRLSRFFETSPEFWMNLQSHYELQVTMDLIAEELAATIKPYKSESKEKKALRKSNEILF